MSRFQLIRRFHALFGVTPHQCLIEARIERAKLQLVVTGLLGHAHLPRRRLPQQEPLQAGQVKIAICSDTCGNLIQLYQPA